MEKSAVLETAISFQDYVSYWFSITKNITLYKFLNPAIKLRRVDFPHPDFPNIVTISPCKI